MAKTKFRFLKLGEIKRVGDSLCNHGALLIYGDQADWTMLDAEVGSKVTKEDLLFGKYRRPLKTKESRKQIVNTPQASRDAEIIRDFNERHGVYGPKGMDLTNSNVFPKGFLG